jgi:tyrosinase
MADEVVADPTYLGHVRHFFDAEDIQHMGRLGVDLSTYEALKERATSVFFRTRPPNPTMPPDPARHWSPERSETFANWIENGCPLGEPIPRTPTPPGEVAERVRKDASELTQEEIESLKLALEAIMGRPTDDPASYFALAGTHWYPAPNECLHHEERFNPWHRVYITKFEDALRSVPGAEAVTLPYWDITQPPPDFLFEPPFASYTLPVDVHPDYPMGHATTRFDVDSIVQNVAARGIAATIDHAMGQPTWEAFITYVGLGIEAAHDDGHMATGMTLSKPDTAAFDPIFWLFHSNWDRLWWEWQQVVDGTTVVTFRSTIAGSAAFLDPPFNDLRPFAETADQTIDLSAMGISYAPPATRTPDFAPVLRLATAGSLRAAEGIRVAETQQASVRLKGIDRLSIPGSFTALLRADGEVIGQRGFFQSSEPQDCATCRERAKIDLDFLVDVDQLRGRALTASIELASPDPELGSTIPLTACGNPTLNARLLLEKA